MKALKYTFSIKEKILLLIFTLILMGFGYYYYIYVPTISGIVECESKLTELNSESDLLMTQIVKFQNMKSELDEMDLENESYLASYNCSKQEMSYLNDILKGTDKYSVSFSDVTVEGNLVRRKFSIQFECEKYDTVKYIIDKLYNCKYRCLIEDIDISTDNNIYAKVPFDPEKPDVIKTSLSACFYETMTGGVIDAGLPEGFGQNTVESDTSDVVN